MVISFCQEKLVSICRRDVTRFLTSEKKADYRGILPRLRLGILKVSKDGLACGSLGNQQTFLTPYIKKLAPPKKLKSSAFPPWIPILEKFRTVNLKKKIALFWTLQNSWIEDLSRPRKKFFKRSFRIGKADGFTYCGPSFQSLGQRKSL